MNYFRIDPANKSKKLVMRLNIGCGLSPTEGYRNFDNSLSIRLSKIPLLTKLASLFGIISAEQIQFIDFVRSNNIEYGDITKGLPVKSESCEVVYSSHTLEHLDRGEAEQFCKEILRILRPGGIVRIVIPDLKRHVLEYLNTGDADQFIKSTYMGVCKPKTLSQRIQMAVVGPRHHQWMYDGHSLSKLLISQGFINPNVLETGETTIPDPGELNLSERSHESVYVEAIKPDRRE